MAHSVKCLSCKHEDLSLIPKTEVKKVQVWYCVLVNLELGKRRAADPWGSMASQSSLLANETRCLKNGGQ